MLEEPVEALQCGPGRVLVAPVPRRLARSAAARLAHIVIRSPTRGSMTYLQGAFEQVQRVRGHGGRSGAPRARGAHSDGIIYRATRTASAASRAAPQLEEPVRDVHRPPARVGLQPEGSRPAPRLPGEVGRLVKPADAHQVVAALGHRVTEQPGIVALAR